MTAKKLRTGLWVVESPSVDGTRIEVFQKKEEADRYMQSQLPFIKFLTQLRNLLWKD
jgi:hypothetical protein